MEEGGARGDKLSVVGALPVRFVGRRMIAGGAGFRFMLAMLTHKITPCSAEKCEKRKASLSIVSQMS